jgi:hypothetical protein
VPASDKCSSLRFIYTGKVCWQKRQRYHDAILPPQLALTSLGNMTQIGRYYFVWHHPRWKRQVRLAFLWHDTANSFDGKLCQWKHGITKMKYLLPQVLAPSCRCHHDEHKNALAYCSINHICNKFCNNALLINTVSCSCLQMPLQ